MKTNWKFAVLLALIAGLGTWVALDHRARAAAENLLRRLTSSASHAEEPRPSKEWTSKPSSKTTWDHLITLTPEQYKGIGLQTVSVQKQTLPTLLRLSGITDYDPATLTIVRTQ